jgi:hypothetical protein
MHCIVKLLQDRVKELEMAIQMILSSPGILSMIITSPILKAAT